MLRKDVKRITCIGNKIALYFLIMLRARISLECGSVPCSEISIKNGMEEQWWVHIMSPMENSQYEFKLLQWRRFGEGKICLYSTQISSLVRSVSWVDLTISLFFSSALYSFNAHSFCCYKRGIRGTLQRCLFLYSLCFIRLFRSCSMRNII